MNQTQLPSGVVRLQQLGLIKATGADAAHFLHNQLTQDFLLLKDDQARLAGYCSAKGRLLASFIAWRSAPQTLLLLMPRDMIAPTIKRLGMFILRAKLSLQDASEEYDIAGLTGTLAQSLMGERALQPWAKTDIAFEGLANAQGACLHALSLYPALGMPRALWVAPVGTPLPQGPQLSQDWWQWGQVCSGVLLLPHGLADALVPQMINYESVGGVNFKKGCYPGQEVVARSQFRGTLKRRGYLLSGRQCLAPGTELFHSGDATQPCGVVLDAALKPAGAVDGANEVAMLFASLQVSATQQGTLHSGSSDGPTLTVCPLPYPLLEDI